MKTVTLEKCTT